MADGQWHFTHTNNYYSADGVSDGNAPSYMGYEYYRGASTGGLLCRTETKHWLATSPNYTPVYPPTGQVSAGSEDGKWADTYSNYAYDRGGNRC